MASCEAFPDVALAQQQAEDDTHEDLLLCPICMDAIAPEDLAVVKGCEHLYCCFCILKWAAASSARAASEPAWCPQCKAPFNYLILHRLLDGGLSDMQVEESVVLLKVAKWFTERVRHEEHGRLLCGAADEEAEHYDEYDEYDEEESAGGTRIVLGNRRLGRNGFIASGRMLARPVQPVPVAGRGKGGRAKGGASGSGNAGSSSGGGAGASGASSSGAAAAGAEGQEGKGKGKPGRRAMRNARRAAADQAEQQRAELGV